MSADVLIFAAGTAPIPAAYTVPNAQEIEPLVVTATIDGSAAAGEFVPVLELVSDGGIVFARIPVDEALAVGGAGEVTWAPALFGQAAVSAVFASQAIAVSAAGSTQLVAAVSGHRTRVRRVALMAAGTVSVKFVDGAGDLTGQFPLLASTGFVMGPGDSEFWFQTGINSALSINLSAGIAVGGVFGFETV